MDASSAARHEPWLRVNPLAARPPRRGAYWKRPPRGGTRRPEAPTAPRGPTTAPHLQMARPLMPGARASIALTVLAIFPWLAWPAPARAQVNTEVFRKRIKAKGYSFFLQGTFDGHTGNTQGATAD